MCHLNSSSFNFFSEQKVHLYLIALINSVVVFLKCLFQYIFYLIVYKLFFNKSLGFSLLLDFLQSFDINNNVIVLSHIDLPYNHLK